MGRFLCRSLDKETLFYLGISPHEITQMPVGRGSFSANILLSSIEGEKYRPSSQNATGFWGVGKESNNTNDLSWVRGDYYHNKKQHCMLADTVLPSISQH